MQKILVVDDALADRALVGGLLTKSMDCTVLEAPDGKEALAQIESERPDLVLTDLNMPQLNGLELVTAVKDDYPLIPVILITAQGSEEIAAEALQRGAASYVPKRRLAQDLMTTVDRVMQGSKINRIHAHLMHYLTENESVFVLHNDLGLIQSLVSHLQQMLRCLPLGDETERLRVGIALGEALSNAYYHGNLEIDSNAQHVDRKMYDELAMQRCGERPYRDLRIHVCAKVSREEGRFIIRDEGPGFDTSQLPDSITPSVDPDQHTGRGIILMRSIMDEIIYNDVGNEVTMIKRRFQEDEDEIAELESDE